MTAPGPTIAYLRVSTDKQADSGLSLDAQRRKVTLYAELHGLELAEVVVETASGGAVSGRPGLAGALERLRRARGGLLLVVKLDRLTRSVRDLSDLVALADRQGWSLASMEERLDTSSAAGRLVLNVLASTSQWEREAIGERTAAAMAQLRRAGRHTGGEPPYGWRVGAGGALEPHPGEVAVMATARELRAAGLSLRAVGEALAAEGAAPRSGGHWHPQTVARLLEPVAVGA